MNPLEKAVNDFLDEHLVECTQELSQQQETGILVSGGRVFQLAQICREWMSPTHLDFAMSAIKNAAVKRVCQLAENTYAEKVLAQIQQYYSSTGYSPYKLASKLLYSMIDKDVPAEKNHILIDMPAGENLPLVMHYADDSVLVLTGSSLFAKK